MFSVCIQAYPNPFWFFPHSDHKCSVYHLYEENYIDFPSSYPFLHRQASENDIKPPKMDDFVDIPILNPQEATGDLLEVSIKIFKS